MRVPLIGLMAVTMLMHATFVRAQSAASGRERRVHEQIAFQISPGDGKTLLVAPDGRGSFAPLKKGEVFSTSGPVDITMERLNPLTTLVTAEVTEADDPSYATVGKFIEALLQAAQIVNPESAALERGLGATERSADDRAAGQSCQQVRDATAMLRELDQTLFHPAWSAARIKPAVAEWVSAVDAGHRSQGSGPAAVQAAVAAIDKYLNTPPRAETDATARTLRQVLDAATAAVKKAAAATADGTGTCDEEANVLYQTIRLTNPSARLAAISSIYESIVGLRKLLDTVYANPANWFGDRKTSYIVRRAVEPSNDKMQAVAVKVQSLDYTNADAVTPVVLAKREDLVTGTFTVRQYSLLSPEIGAGVTFARFTRPAFGTEVNAAGQTVVAVTERKTVSANPTVMMNLVWRTGLLPMATPMVQFGVSTDKDAPVLFLGGGIRLFHAGRGDVAIGFGRAFPWVKQLKKLSVGDVVSASSEVEADLGFGRLEGERPTYLMLQYKF